MSNLNDTRDMNDTSNLNHTTHISEQAFLRAQSHLVGGVNSPVRAFKHVGGCPKVIKKAQGPYLYDVSGRRYIDFVNGWGANLLGHAPSAICTAVQTVVEQGICVGFLHDSEIELASLLKSFMPKVEKCRFMSSGTEATMTAIRLARAITKKTKIIKFAGGYHGHSDALLVKAGSGGLTLSLPDSAGVPPEFAGQTLVAPFNDLDAVSALFNAHPGEIAAIIVEPVAANMNLVLPKPGFLQGLQQLCRAQSALLIFDEVITGFRVDRAGASHYYQVMPDLTCLGKVLGGGFPIGAVVGSTDLLSYLAPLGPVYQAGTLSGSPITMAAGIATLNALTPDLSTEITQKTAYFVQKINEIANQHAFSLKARSIGSLFGLHFAHAFPDNLDAVQRANQDQFKAFFHACLEAGLQFAPSAYECGFMTAAHTRAVLDDALERCETVIKQLTKKNNFRTTGQESALSV